MKHIKDIHPLVEQVRQRIIETMQERGLTKVDIIPSLEDYEQEHKDAPDYNEAEWHELRRSTCPAITYYDNSMGYSFDVISVELVTDEQIGQCFELNCCRDYDDEFEEDCFYDRHVIGMQGVYEALERVLGLDNEPEKIWLLKQESNCDGEYLFNVTPCKDKDTAILQMKAEINTLLKESPKYVDALRWIEGDDETLDYDLCPYSYEISGDDSFYISCVNDDYHELFTIAEVEIK